MNMSYDYICTDCGKEFIVRHHIDGPETAVVCPDCGSPARKSYRSAPALIYNWWNAKASSSAGLDYQRHHPSVSTRSTR